MDAFLDRPDIKPILGKYFIPVKLVVQENEKNKALENLGADAILKRLGGPAGLPYSAFLDRDGKLIVSCGDFMFNSGEHQLCIMRWSSRRLLHNAWVDWKMNWCRVVRDGPPVGEDSYWNEDLTTQKLTFRRGLLTVAITAGLRSDYQPMLRLTQAIDAKIRGRPIPHVRTAAKPDWQENAIEPANRR